MQGINKIYSLIIGIIVICIFLLSCSTSPGIPDRNFRQDMRDFVIRISDTARITNPAFIVIPQNGQELISLTEESGGPLAIDYIAAIDGTGREDLYYGYENDNEATPPVENEYMKNYLEVFKLKGIEVLITDYCSDHTKMDNSYQLNFNNNYISFAADRRELNNIPDYPSNPYQESSDNIANISQAKNFLYIINSNQFATKQDFIDDVSSTNYDIILMDLYHNEEAYTSDEISQLKIKDNNGSRLVIAYMSIGEAEDYRFYWDNSWNSKKPVWLDKENPDWAGNYKVRYWEQSWQEIIYGNDNSYLKNILSAGFDGVYLDIIDGFEYFENY